MIKKITNNSFARNSLVLLSGTMAANILNYFFHLIIGRMVSVEIYGEIEALISFAMIISIPTMALTMVATKLGAGYKADNDKKGNYAFFQYLNKKIFFAGIPFFLVALVFTPVVKNFLNISDTVPVLLLWLFMLVSFFSSASVGILSGWQKFKEISWAGILGTLIKLVGAIFIIKSGFVLGGAIAGFFLGSLLTYLATVYFLKSTFETRKESGVAWKNPNLYSIKKYITPVVVGNLAINILGNADMVIAKHNLSSQLAGQYGALTIVSKIIFFATGIIATVLFSMSAENNHKKNSSVHILKNAALYMGIISLGAVVLYFSFSKFLLELLFGGKYNDVSQFLGWFSVLVVLYSFVNLFLQYFLSIHKTQISYIFLLVAAFEIGLIFLVGHSIFAILVAVIIAQALALFASLIFLVANRNYKITS